MPREFSREKKNFDEFLAWLGEVPGMEMEDNADDGVIFEEDYRDILDSKRPTSARPKMAREKRAKQFAAFEALGELE